MAAHSWGDYCERSLHAGDCGGQAEATGKTRRRAAMARPFSMPGDKLHYARDKQFTMHHIKIEVSLDVAQKKVAGTSSLTLSPILDGLSVVEIDAIDLRISSITMAVGAEAPAPVAYDVGDETLRVRLPQPLNAGQRATIAIAYEGTPRRGIYFIGPDASYPDKPVQVWTQGQDHDSRYWVPCYDFPNQRATSEIIATVPENMFVLSNGSPVKDTHDAASKTRTYHWSQDRGHATYLITLVAGVYKVISDSADGVPIRYYVPPHREEDGRQTFKNTPEMVGLFTRLTGARYPWDKYAQITVADFIFGGMENTSATTLTDATLRDARARIDSTSEPLIAHELAHQWFGDWLTCKDWSHAWLNEGFATYFEALYTEHHLGENEFRYEMFQNARAYLNEAGQYERPIVTRIYSEPIDIFDRHLYEKGSLVLHMLRYLLGDALFFRSIQHYVKKHADGVVDSEDFRQAIEDASGKTMEGFFEQWVYKAGHPNFKVSYSWDDEAQTAKVTVAQTQDEKDSSVFQMPVVIDFSVHGESKAVRVNLTEKEHHFYFPLDAKPSMVRFDPGDHILKRLEEDLPKELHLERLRHDDDPIGRVRAAQALGKLGSAEAIHALKDAILQDAFWGVQAEAAAALGTVKTTAARLALLECLTVRHPKARRAVVAALGALKDASVAGPLIQILADGDDSYYVEAEAARSLGKTRSPKAFDALTGALHKASYQEVVRTGIMDGLAELKDPRGLDIAREWAQYGKPQPGRAAALGAAAKLGEERKDNIEYLADFLYDPWLRVRIRAIDALEALGDWKAVGPLEQMINRELDARVRRNAKEAIAGIRDEIKPKQEVKKLQEDVDKLREDNRSLTDRLDKMESRFK